MLCSQKHSVFTLCAAWHTVHLSLMIPASLSTSLLLTCTPIRPSTRPSTGPLEIYYCDATIQEMCLSVPWPICTLLHQKEGEGCQGQHCVKDEGPQGPPLRKKWKASWRRGLLQGCCDWIYGQDRRVHRLSHSRLGVATLAQHASAQKLKERQRLIS